MTILVRGTLLVALSLSLLGTGCKSRGADYVPPAMSEPVQASDSMQRESQLRELVQRRKIQAAHSREEEMQEVKRKPPYFFREYGTYPDGDGMEIEFQETESRSNPVRASVVVPKVRFSTRLNRDRSDAMRDTNFVRDTGYERQEYTLRNGRWVSLGNTFVAETSEMQVNGEWVPVREEEEAPMTQEEEGGGGWFRRAWDRVSGG